MIATPGTRKTAKDENDEEGGSISTRIGFWIHRRGSRTLGKHFGRLVHHFKALYITDTDTHYSNESAWKANVNQSHSRRQWSEWTRINPQASFLCILLAFLLGFIFLFLSFLLRYFVCMIPPKTFSPTLFGINSTIFQHLLRGSFTFF